MGQGDCRYPQTRTDNIIAMKLQQVSQEAKTQLVILDDQDVFRCGMHRLVWCCHRFLALTAVPPSVTLLRVQLNRC